MNKNKILIELEIPLIEKSYDLYIWVSSDAGNEYMDKTFSAAIVLDNATS